MEQGFLAPHQLFAADAQITEQGVRTVRGDHDTALHQQWVVGVAGDVVATCQPLKTERMPTLCAGGCRRITPRSWAFQSTGIKAQAVDGETSTTQRDRNVSDVR